VPSLQLDAPAHYDAQTQRELAKRFGAIYAEVMRTRADIVTVAIRETGVWRCGDDDEPQASALLMCDVRRGRPAEIRAELSRRLIEACVDVLGLDPLQIKVEFTQHAGDEMYHPQLGGFNRDWDGDE
jgi:phenylpyruvate tautomerase PptA (4-oxalocrotonate tautomerase family)